MAPRRYAQALVSLALARTLVALRQHRATPSPGIAVPHADDIARARARMLGAWDEWEPTSDIWTVKFAEGHDEKSLLCRVFTLGHDMPVVEDVALEGSREAGVVRFEGFGPPPVPKKAKDSQAEYRFSFRDDGFIEGSVVWRAEGGSFVTKDFSGVRAPLSVEAMREALMGKWKETSPAWDSMPDIWIYDFRPAADGSLRVKVSTHEMIVNDDYTDSLLLEPVEQPVGSDPPWKFRGAGGAHWIPARENHAVYEFWLGEGGLLKGDVLWNEGQTSVGKSISARRLQG